MKIKLLSSGAKVPTRADEGAAGYDLYTPTDVIVNPGRNIIPLDICIEVPHGYEASIRPRSGFSAKGFEGIPAGQGQYDPKPQRYDADVLYGTVDESYRNTVGVIVISRETHAFEVPAGTRIAQMVITPYLAPEMEVADELSTTDRTGGFGSTGTK